MSEEVLEVRQPLWRHPWQRHAGFAVLDVEPIIVAEARVASGAPTVAEDLLDLELGAAPPRRARPAAAPSAAARTRRGDEPGPGGAAISSSAITAPMRCRRHERRLRRERVEQPLRVVGVGRDRRAHRARSLDRAARKPAAVVGQHGVDVLEPRGDPVARIGVAVAARAAAATSGPEPRSRWWHSRARHLERPASRRPRCRHAPGIPALAPQGDGGRVSSSRARSARVRRAPLNAIALLPPCSRGGRMSARSGGRRAYRAAHSFIGVLGARALLACRRRRTCALQGDARTTIVGIELDRARADGQRAHAVPRHGLHAGIRVPRSASSGPRGWGARPHPFAVR